MNTSKNILFAALLATGLAANSQLEAWFFDFDDFDAKMEQQMNQMRQSMHNMGKQFEHAFKNSYPNRNVSMETKDNALRITIPNIEGEQIEANLDETQKKLTITVPQLKIIVATRNRIVAVELIEEHKIVEKDDKGVESEFFNTSVSRMDKSVPREPLLEQQTIDYDQENKQLIVIIPIKEEYKGKPVAINKINSKK